MNLCHACRIELMVQSSRLFQYRCEQCGKVFVTKRGASVHASNRFTECVILHLPLRRKFCRGGTFLGCLIVFASKRRLIEYLREKSRRCCRHYINLILDVDVEAWGDIETEDKELARTRNKSSLRRMVAEVRSFKLQGPRPKG